jgi:hypothetical protein
MNTPPTFRTTLPSQSAPHRISHADPLLLVGSCFAEHIGARLAAHKFDTLTNPTGIVYNPQSMAYALTDDLLPASQLLENQGIWHHLDFHSAFSDADRSVVEARVESARRDLLFFQKKARYVLLTLGTADGFEWAATGRMVANCHKIPAAQFRSRRLSVAEVTDALAAALTTWRVAQPDLRAIVTVSPVRHLRGGLVANQRSKATLLLAAEALCAVLPWADYFPAYELVIDDLRDYRFFAADMVHPSDVAIDYVWQHFADAYFSPETQVLCQQISRLAAAIGHRPFNPDTPQHRAFVAQQLVEVARLEAAHGLDFSTERVLLGRYA